MNFLTEVESEQSTGPTEPQAVDYGLLIEAIQGYPYLYDLSHRLYKDAKRKALAWQHISELLNCAVEDCIEAWRNLRDRFVREKNRLASGAGAPETNWPLYEQMLFYGKSTKPRKTHTSTKKMCRKSAESSASTWSSVTYDSLMSPNTESQTDDEAPGPAKEADSVRPYVEESPSIMQTPSTSSGTKRKRVVQAKEEDAEGILSIAKNIATQLVTKPEKNPNSTFTEYMCQELEKLNEVDPKKKKKGTVKSTV